MVVCYGQGKWDAPTSLRELMDPTQDLGRLAAYVNGWPMHLIDVGHIRYRFETPANIMLLDGLREAYKEPRWQGRRQRPSGSFGGEKARGEPVQLGYAVEALLSIVNPERAAPFANYIEEHPDCLRVGGKMTYAFEESDESLTRKAARKVTKETEAKWLDNQAMSIRNLHAMGMPGQKIAEALNCDIERVRDVLGGNDM